MSVVLLTDFLHDGKLHKRGSALPAVLKDQADALTKQGLIGEEAPETTAVKSELDRVKEELAAAKASLAKAQKPGDSSK